jgi:hypothetical protein
LIRLIIASVVKFLSKMYPTIDGVVTPSASIAGGMAIDLALPNRDAL